MEYDATPAVTVCWYAVDSGNYSTVPITVSNVPIQERNRIESGSRARTRSSTGNILCDGGHSGVKQEMTTTSLRWEEERYKNHSKPHERSGEEQQRGTETIDLDPVLTRGSHLLVGIYTESANGRTLCWKPWKTAREISTPTSRLNPRRLTGQAALLRLVAGRLC